VDRHSYPARDDPFAGPQAAAERLGAHSSELPAIGDLLDRRIGAGEEASALVDLVLDGDWRGSAAELAALVRSMAGTDPEGPDVDPADRVAGLGSTRPGLPGIPARPGRPVSGSAGLFHGDSVAGARIHPWMAVAAYRWARRVNDGPALARFAALVGSCPPLAAVYAALTTAAARAGAFADPTLSVAAIEALFPGDVRRSVATARTKALGPARLRDTAGSLLTTLRAWSPLPQVVVFSASELVVGSLCSYEPKHGQVGVRCDTPASVNWKWMRAPSVYALAVTDGSAGVVIPTRSCWAGPGRRPATRYARTAAAAGCPDGPAAAGAVLAGLVGADVWVPGITRDR